MHMSVDVCVRAHVCVGEESVFKLHTGCQGTKSRLSGPSRALHFRLAAALLTCAVSSDTTSVQDQGAAFCPAEIESECVFKTCKGFFLKKWPSLEDGES